MNPTYRKILAEIRQAERISLFFHEKPDPDCLGCAFGLHRFIKDNFPGKDVRIAGLHLVDPSEVPAFFPIGSKKVPNAFISGSLGIVMDTANRPRIQDQRYSLARTLIKIDHHPNIDPFGDILYVKDAKSSAAEIVADFMFSTRLSVSPETATFLYAGIVTDTGGFRFVAVDHHTHQIAAKLLKTGMDKRVVYSAINARSVRETRAVGYILSNYQVTPEGIAFLVVRPEQELLFTGDEVKKLINVMSGIDGVEIWAICIYDQKRGTWRSSFRSRVIEINKVVEVSGGGGHRHAAGAELESEQQFYNILDQLKGLIVEYKKKNRAAAAPRRVSARREARPAAVR